MSERRYLYSIFFVILLAVLSYPFRSGTMARAATASTICSTDNLPTLILWDKSAGAAPCVKLWKDIATTRNVGATVAKVYDTIESVLASETWGTVIVCLKHPVASSNGSVESIKSYVTAHPSRRVILYVWNDHDEIPAEGAAVLATTAVAVWQGNATVVTYAGMANSNGETMKPREYSGLVLPDFEGIESSALYPIGTVVLAADGIGIESIIGTPQNDCTARCWQTFVEKTTECVNYHTADIAVCDLLYGPDTPNPDAVQWVNCINEANTFYSLCMRVSLWRYQRCIKTCIPASQPAG